MMEQSAAFVSTYTTEYGIIVPSFVTCNLLRSADLAGKKEWKITTDSDTTWRAYQSEVKDIRKKIIPLWDALVRLTGESVPLGKALIELLDKFPFSVYLSEQKARLKVKTIDYFVTNIFHFRLVSTPRCI